jgi:hypothetical protein
MKQALVSNATTDEKVAALEQQVLDYQARIESLEHQLEWFKRQLFGRKSEKRHLEDLPEQPLLTGFDAEPPARPAPETQKITYTR